MNTLSFQAIWFHLFKKESSSNTGTLAQAKGFLGVTNVPDLDPQKSFYPCSDLLDKFSEAYITAGALNHFGMADFDQEPSLNINPESRDLMNSPEEFKRNFIMQESFKFVKENVHFSVPDLKKDAPRSNTFKCIYCDNNFKHAKALKKHERQSHSHPESEENLTAFMSESEDPVVSYTQKAITLLLLREEHNEAIHINDGDRIMRVNRVLTLLYKESKCPKYAYGMLEMMAQQVIFLPPRLAYQMRWNRTVNYRGEVDSNFPLDLDMEHDNGMFKNQIKTYRGDFTEKALRCVSRSSRLTEEILCNVDKASHVSKPKGKHSRIDAQQDILDLSLQFSKKQLFTKQSRKPHKGFEQVPILLSTLKTENISDWISKTLNTLKRKHYYFQFNKPL